LLAFAALLIVAIAETSRIPIDNPDTHLELTMVHEGMLLEYSGRPLGVLHWATQIKQFAVVALLVALFWPWGMATPGDHAVTALGVGLVTFCLKAGMIGLLLAAIESGFAKLRIFRAPDLIGLASVLGVLAVLATYVVER
jgi:formate hydrogenlyase subunit 4